MKAYTAKNGKTRYKPGLDDIEAHISEDDMTGYCLACGSENGSVEPDAEKYPCDSCGEQLVFGCEQLLLRGLYHTDDASEDRSE